MSPGRNLCDGTMSFSRGEFNKKTFRVPENDSHFARLLTQSLWTSFADRMPHPTVARALRNAANGIKFFAGEILTEE